MEAEKGAKGNHKELQETFSWLEELTRRPWERAADLWKEKNGDAPVIGCFPVYCPIEIVHAAGGLPLGMFGAGTEIELSHADARFQSFVCSIAKSTLELGLQEQLHRFDGFLFHSICDVARNLWSIFQRNFPDLFLGYIHYPQNPSSDQAVVYFASELGRIQTALEQAFDAVVSDEALVKSIDLYNQVRERLFEIRDIRRRHPETVSLQEAYLLERGASLLEPMEYLQMMENVLPSIQARHQVSRDAIRVLVVGAFCEQPPLDFLDLLEETGCYVVNDDLLLGWRWFTEPVSTNGKPLEALASAFLRRSVPSSVVYGTKPTRFQRLVDDVKASDAGAVLFCTPKFCEPALFDYVHYRKTLDAVGIPHLQIEFEEKMWTFERTRNELETFVESILFD